MGVGDELAPRMSTVMQKGWTCAHLLRNTYQGCLVSMGEAEEREGEKERAAAERGLAKGQDAVRVAQRRLAGRPTYYLTADCDDVLTKVPTHTRSHAHTDANPILLPPLRAGRPECSVHHRWHHRPKQYEGGDEGNTHMHTCTCSPSNTLAP